MARYGIVLPQTIILTSGKSSFSNIIATLQRGAIVEVSEEGTDGWGKLRDEDSGTEGFSVLTNFALMDEHPNVVKDATPFESYEVVVMSNARLRSGAGVQFGVVGNVDAKKMLTVLAEEPEWLKVEVGDGSAYISTHLTERKDTSKIQGFLIDMPDLLNYPLEPKNIIPTKDLAEGKRPFACARVWNTFGGLIEELAKRLQIPVSTLVAAIAAESSGKAFGADARMIIRFEVHIFHRYWGVNNQALFDQHFQFQSWKSHKFRLNATDEWKAVHTTQEREWQVLEFARSLDDTAALKSISMGAPQMMGFNFKIMGYESVQEMFESFAKSAQAQILGMLDFIRSAQAIRHLQSGDILSFATIYNGSGNAHTYEGIINDYIAIYSQLITTAQAVPDTTGAQLRGPSDVGTPAPEAEEVANSGFPSELPTTQPTTAPSVTVSAPAQAETVIYTRDSVNVRAAADPNANILGAFPRGTTLKLLESLESAIKKIEAGEAGKQYVNVDYNGQSGFVAAWFTSPGKMLTQASVMRYIDGLPQRPIPSGYDTFWSHQEHLGLPDPFDVLPVQIKSESELVNMQVNGFGPNTFSLYNGAVWYSRIGYMHNGYDFIVKTGTPLLAVGDGLIIRNWVFMANPAEKTTVLWCFLPEKYRDSQGRRMMSNVLVAYGHMSNASLRKKHEIVKAGDVIGLAGTPAGSTTNDHLHYEIHLLQGDPNMPNNASLPKRRLAEFKRDSNTDNKTPFNALLFYSKRVVQYSLHQGETIGFGRSKSPEYPTLDMLKAKNAQHLHPVDPFTLAYFRYGISNVWKAPANGKAWGDGVVTLDMLNDRLPTFAKFEPYEASFLG